jgi:hypothetical protein
MKRCPICNGLIDQYNHCRRCSADLNDLIRVDEYTNFLRQRAFFYWEKNNIIAAYTYITRALHLRKTDFNILIYGAIKYALDSSTQKLLELQ